MKRAMMWKMDETDAFRKCKSKKNEWRLTRLIFPSIHPLSSVRIQKRFIAAVQFMHFGEEAAMNMKKSK